MCIFAERISGKDLLVILSTVSTDLGLSKGLLGLGTIR